MTDINTIPHCHNKQQSKFESHPFHSFLNLLKNFNKMMKTVAVLALATFVIAFAHPSCPGCTTTLEGDGVKEAADALNLSLNKLAAGDGPSYKLTKINSATSQVVSGHLYKINADLSEGDQKKTCDITIHSQPWLKNGIEVTFECNGEAKLVKKHSA